MEALAVPPRAALTDSCRRRAPASSPAVAPWRWRRRRWRAVGAVASSAKVLDDSTVDPVGIGDFIARARDLAAARDGGPPRWFSPLESGRCADGSPVLLYLPGIDGTGMGLVRHHQRLGKVFDIWCLHIPVEDRTPFEVLVEYVERTVKYEASCFMNRPIYLLGESIGACIALAVAIRNPDIDLVLVLANPGTSYGQSQLQSLAIFFDVVLEPFHAIAQSFHSSFTGKSTLMKLDFLENQPFLQENLRRLSEKSGDILPFISFLVDILPKDTLLWKLKMLRSASTFVNSRLHAVKADILILASGKDQLFPSREEAERLRIAFPESRIRHFNDSGHIIFLEDNLDLVTTIRGAGFYRRSRSLDYVSDYLLPTVNEVRSSLAQFRWLDVAANPVMFSTLPNGKIIKGLDGIPSEGPALLVGYHMLLGWEIGHLIERFLIDKNIHLRGIAHPFMFDRTIEQLAPWSTFFDGYKLMGAVPVSATSFYKLLSRKSFVLLYPGGVREALHGKGEQYKLFWPEQSEFIRMASRFDATIIPFGVVGEDDICDFFLDYDDQRKIPFLCDLLDRLNFDAVRLRANATGEVANQNIYIPGVLPKLPGRMYFLFGKPIETRGRKQELRDRGEALEMYVHVRSEVEKCISYLLERRGSDPYRSIVPRLIYQSLNGFSAEVPTFEP